MTFSYTPADSPAIWMQFVPARENTARPAEEDNRLTEGMVHTGMNNETIDVEAGEKRTEEKVSTVAENISENGVSQNTVGPHIRSVDNPSRLAECEYQRDCISMGKEQADPLSDNFFDSLKLTTTTDRGRDAVVVGLRTSTDQSGSPADWNVSKHDTNNLLKEFCVVASLPDGKRLSVKQCRNDRLRHPKIDRLPSSQAKSGARYCCRAVGDKHQISSAKMPRLVGPVVGMKSTMISHGQSLARHAQMTEIERHRGLMNQRSVGLLRHKRFRRRPLVQKYRSFVIPASGIFWKQGVTVSCPA